MVIFRSADGKPGYHQAETLEEAVRFVERLRNDEQVADARVFRMDEVPIEFKVYYRVEVAGFETAAEPASAGEPVPPAAASEATAGDAAAEPVAEAQPAEGDATGDPAMAGNGAGSSSGRFGLFSR